MAKFVSDGVCQGETRVLVDAAGPVRLAQPRGVGQPEGVTRPVHPGTYILPTTTKLTNHNRVLAETSNKWISIK